MGSNGHVTYIIKTQDNVPENTLVSNTAHIYFDFNPAIVTNTVNSVMVEEFPISSTEEELKSAITLYPNPTKSTLHFSEEVHIGHLENTQGQRVLSFESVDNINLRVLYPGIYIVTFFDKEGKLVITEKIVKM